MLGLLQPPAPSARCSLSLGETAEIDSVVGRPVEKWTWLKWGTGGATVKRCKRGNRETLELPRAADGMTPAVLRRDIVVNAWRAVDSGPTEQSRLELRIDPLGPFLFVRGYFGSEHIERLPSSPDRTRVYRR